MHFWSQENLLKSALLSKSHAFSEPQFPPLWRGREASLPSVSRMKWYLSNAEPPGTEAAGQTLVELSHLCSLDGPFAHSPTIKALGH